MVASVRPIHARTSKPVIAAAPAAASEPAPPKLRAPPAKPAPVARPAKSTPGITLDGTWDRRLSRGLVQPDATIDLHGHNLATAYSYLDHRLEQTIASGARVLLLITGKPPRDEPPHARGAIRGAVGDWLAASRHAGNIAAVRGAHPRHGGQGALYIVLRKRR